MKASIKAAVLGMNAQEMNELVDIIKYRRRELQTQIKNSFSVGQRVSIKAKGGNIIGKIVKINPKRIVVEEEKNKYQTWSCTPSLLTAI